MNLKIERIITSLRLITFFVLSYTIGFAFKISYFFSEVLSVIITNDYIKGITSGLSGFLLAGGLLIATTNKNELGFRFIKHVFFLFDIVTMLFILKAFNQTGIELYKVVFISVLFTTVGMTTITVFASRLSKEETKQKQNKAREEQKQAEIKRLDAFKCKKCNRQFKNQNALNAHKCSKLI